MMSIALCVKMRLNLIITYFFECGYSLELWQWFKKLDFAHNSLAEIVSYVYDRPIFRVFCKDWQLICLLCLAREKDFSLKVDLLKVLCGIIKGLNLKVVELKD